MYERAGAAAPLICDETNIPVVYCFVKSTIFQIAIKFVNEPYYEVQYNPAYKTHFIQGPRNCDSSLPK